MNPSPLALLLAACLQEHANASRDEIAFLIDQALDEHVMDIGAHSGENAHREWWSGSAWLYPGDRVVVLSQ